MKPAHIPVVVIDLFPVLDRMLIELLRSLSPEDWQRQTVAKLWKVKDVAAHLLDGNIRILSMLRDEYRPENPDIQSYQDLVNYLNGLNADWVKAMKRLSPQLLIFLHEQTGAAYGDYYASLDPMGAAIFPVAWAGENESLNWMHIARDYTEKWLHQQQIRDAVNKPALLEPMFFRPFLHCCMFALPYTFRDVRAAKGTTVVVNITREFDYSFGIIFTGTEWQPLKTIPRNVSAEVFIDADLSWKLFSKSLRPDLEMPGIRVAGDSDLCQTALQMVSFMA